MTRNTNLMDSGILELLTARPRPASHEEIEPDRRAELKPSEIVQAKLLSLMPGLPVSSLHTRRETHRGNYSPTRS